MGQDAFKPNFEKSESDSVGGNVEGSFSQVGPYAYKYGIQDDLSGTNFEKSESKNVGGNVEGSFSVVLPDGRIQTVTYTFFSSTNCES